MKWLVAIIFIFTIIFSGVLADDLVYQNATYSTTNEIADGTSDSGQTFYYVKDEVIVRYKSEVYNKSELYQKISSDTNSRINASIIEDYGSIGLPGMQLLLLSNNTTADQAIAYFSNITYIEYAQYNYVTKIDRQNISPDNLQTMGDLQKGYSPSYPNDPYFGQQWYLTKINAPGAWGIATGSSNIEIAVLDSGIDIIHQDLRNNIDKIHASSIVRDPHGTVCTGVLAAEGNNGIGISGVMWHASIIPIVVADSNNYIYSSYVISGVYQAHQYGAQILSCSFGFSSDNLAMRDAFTNSDALVICAAGNSGTNNDIKPLYPASYNTDNIISVAGTDENDNLAVFSGEPGSNYGATTVDLAAPGTLILTTAPGNGYEIWEGTSFSAPMVAGVAGLIKSYRPELTNAQIKAAILNNVDTLPSLNGKVATGGRLNAYKALKSVEKPGSISIQSTPVGAKIYLDTTDTGYITPKTLSDVPTGSHVIRCSLNGYDDAFQIVDVVTGQTVPVQIVLKKATVIPGGTNYQYVSTLGSPGSGNGQLNEPNDVAVDETRNRIYIADTRNQRIQVFDRNGSFITQWGYPGQFSFPSGVEVDGETGYVYTVEKEGNRVQEFYPNGEFIRAWGSAGTNNGQFNYPNCIAIDSIRDRVYVTDSHNHRVQVFDRKGNFVFKIDSMGSADGQLMYPVGIAINPTAGMLYVADNGFAPSNTGNYRIEVFDLQGNYLYQWGSFGTALSQFQRNGGLGIDDTGRVFVCEQDNNRIHVFSGSGENITVWGNPGSGMGQLNVPTGVAIDRTTGYVYVADTQNNRIQVFSLMVMTPGPGSLTIQSNPPGATIFIDGVDTGYITPKTIPDLTAGNHNIRCSLKGYNDGSTTVIVVSGQITDVNLNLLSDVSSITLYPGWNFISTPKTLAAGSNTAAIFSNVNMGGHSAFMWDGLQNPPRWVTVLSNTPIQPLYGIWIYSTSNARVNLTFDTTSPTTNPPPRSLSAGWNSIGFTGLNPVSARDTYLSVQPDWVHSMGFNPVTQSYEPAIFNGDVSESTPLNPTRGYWLYMRTPAHLTAVGA